MEIGSGRKFKVFSKDPEPSQIRAKFGPGQPERKERKTPSRSNFNHSRPIYFLVLMLPINRATLTQPLYILMTARSRLMNYA